MHHIHMGPHKLMHLLPKLGPHCSFRYTQQVCTWVLPTTTTTYTTWALSPVYPDTLRLAGTVVSPNTDAREVDPLGVDMQGQGSTAGHGCYTCKYSMSHKEVIE